MSILYPWTLWFPESFQMAKKSSVVFPLTMHRTMHHSHRHNTPYSLLDYFGCKLRQRSMVLNWLQVRKWKEKNEFIHIYLYERIVVYQNRERKKYVEIKQENMYKVRAIESSLRGSVFFLLRFFFLAVFLSFFSGLYKCFLVLSFMLARCSPHTFRGRGGHMDGISWQTNTLHHHINMRMFKKYIETKNIFFPSIFHIVFASILSLLFRRVPSKWRTQTGTAI